MGDQYRAAVAEEKERHGLAMKSWGKLQRQHEWELFQLAREHHESLRWPNGSPDGGADVSERSENDTKLPDGVEPYYLRANTGPRYLMGGVLSRPFITTKQSGGKFAISSIESSSAHPPTVLAQPFSFQKVHQVYGVLDGCI